MQYTNISIRRLKRRNTPIEFIMSMTNDNFESLEDVNVKIGDGAGHHAQVNEVAGGSAEWFWYI